MHRGTVAALKPEFGAEMYPSLADRVLESAALRLGIDPLRLAAHCINGELADVIIELRSARFNLAPSDQERVEVLLRQIGVLP